MSKVTILGNPPSKSNCYRIVIIHGHGSLAKTPLLKKYENSFYLQLNGNYRNLNIETFFEFHVDAYMASMRTDLDGILKCCLDMLQKTKTIKNDNLCVKIVAQKFVDKVNPRIEFEIKQV